MVSYHTCLTILLVVSLTRSSNPNRLFTRFLKRLSISAFPSLAHTLFRFALKSTDVAVVLILISTFDLFFAPINAFLLSLLSRIKFLSFGDLVLYTYLSVDAVPHRMWVKSRVIYTPEYWKNQGLTPITGQPSSSPVMSSIFSHLNTTGHSANFDDFKILSSCSGNCELIIHESLLISKLKPSLNVQGSFIPLNLL